ncbi:MAG: hypothetical protein OSA99_16025, partial [Acidimicrobiales bacterium]|nr:hypothetical protein [Acidimicrobiales bacterium]
MLSILLGVGALGGAAALSPSDRSRVELLVSHTVERVLPTMGYALSQRNNHAISEATFLLIASMLRQRAGDAVDVRRKASAALREAVNDQFADDGSYAQYSFTYQRLALQTLLMLDLVCRQFDVLPPVDLEPLFDRSLQLLERVIDPMTGAMPNAGGN